MNDCEEEDACEQPEEYCSLCGGPLGLLGQLGRRRHLVCRNCGMQFSRLVEED